ncbi:MAG: hypothetical protein WC906_00695 [Parcubacteria group bacterium]|jgi:hypothetical protein
MFFFRKSYEKRIKELETYAFNLQAAIQDKQATVSGLESAIDQLTTEKAELNRRANVEWGQRAHWEGIAREQKEKIDKLTNAPQKSDTPTILIIDDREEEREKACSEVKRRGWKPIACDPFHNYEWIKLIEQADGIMTDMFWEHSNHGQKPMGLLVVIHALFRSKPIVVCTDAGKHANGHHSKEISFIHDGYVREIHYKQGPFGWNEVKNWSEAAQILEEHL